MNTPANNPHPSEISPDNSEALSNNPEISNNTSIKSDFPFFSHHSDLAYLDSAATTQKPRAVLDAARDFYENSNANPDRALYDLGYSATELHASCRRAVADFINAAPEQIIFTSGCTESLNLVALSLAEGLTLATSDNLRSGDEILISIYNHHSNLVPWQQLAKKTGAKLQFFYDIAKTKGDNTSIPVFSELLSPKTKLVIIPHTSNVTGERLPVEKITKLAHLVGAQVVCDAAQAVVHEKLDVKKLDVDFLAFSGHKMYASTGVGVLYVKNPELFTPVFFGGGAISRVSEQDFALAADISRFEPGTRNLAAEVGLKAAIDWLKSFDSLTHPSTLAFKAYSALKNLPDVELISPPNTSIISFNLKNTHPHDAATLLNDEKICVRAGHHCAEPLMNYLNLPGGCVRTSFGLYNDERDVEKFLAAVQKVQEFLR